MASKQCKIPFCPNPAKEGSGYCEEHFDPTKVKRVDTRPQAHKRGYGWAWRKFAKAYLERNPMCHACGNEAQVVDHILPASIIFEKYGDITPEEMESLGLLQPLCRSCNAKKGWNLDKELKNNA